MQEQLFLEGHGDRYEVNRVPVPMTLYIDRADGKHTILKINMPKNATFI